MSRLIRRTSSDVLSPNVLYHILILLLRTLFSDGAECGGRIAKSLCLMIEKRENRDGGFLYIYYAG